VPSWSVCLNKLKGNKRPKEQSENCCIRYAVPSSVEMPLRNSLIVYQLRDLANQGLELPKIHWIEG
jgi:hypothetical protein